MSVNLRPISINLLQEIINALIAPKPPEGQNSSYVVENCKSPCRSAAPVYGCNAAVYGCNAAVYGCSAAVYGRRCCTLMGAVLLFWVFWGGGGCCKWVHVWRGAADLSASSATSQVRYPPTRRYAMPGTDIAYGDICFCACYAKSDTETACGAMRCPRMVLPAGPPPESEFMRGCAISLRVCHAMSGTIVTYCGISLRVWCYAMSGTDMAYGGICLRVCSAIFGTDMAYGGICLHVCSAMSGTDIAYGGICLRVYYAMSGTGVAHGSICLRVCYAMASTETAYHLPGSMPASVLPSAPLLPAALPSFSIWSFAMVHAPSAMSCTYIAYTTTPPHNPRSHHTALIRPLCHVRYCRAYLLRAP
eukprot:431117-Rhodomonas_salina.1